MAPRLVLGLVSALCGAGCASRPVQQAFLEPLPIPHFALDALPVTQVSAAVPIDLIDDRPDWEHESYGGITRYKALHGGTSFFPLESLEPPLHEHLRTELTARMGSVPDRPESVTLRLTSFRVVYRQIGQDKATRIKSTRGIVGGRKKKRERENDDWDDMRPPELREKKDDCDSFFGAMAGASLGCFLESAVEGIVDSVRDGTVASDITSPFRHQTSSSSSAPHPEKLYAAEDKALPPLPKQLGTKYVPGITCEMRGELTVLWPDRSEHTVTLETRIESWHTAPTPCDVESVVPALVHDAIVDFGTKASDQVRLAQRGHGQ